VFSEGAKEIKSLDELSQEDLRIFSIYSVALYKGAPHEKKMNEVFQQKNKFAVVRIATADKNNRIDDDEVARLYRASRYGENVIELGL
jgi:hypothetical protein